MSVLIRDVRVICTAPEKINLVVVKVETNQPGLYGLGCATFAYRHLAVRNVVENYLKPLLVGRDAEEIEELWQLMHQNAYWRNGPVVNNAISGVDMALWDIKGKLAGMPLYQLFGGRVRKGVPVYRHAEGRDLSELIEKIQEFMEQGVTTVRCQMGGYGGGSLKSAPEGAPRGAADGVYLDAKKYVRNTISMFEGIRDKLGYEVDLVHDVHSRINAPQAIRLAKELEPYDLFFLEDPVRIEEIDWLRNLRQVTTTPIAIGELFDHPQEWKMLIMERLIDYIRVHISEIGGITPARKLAIFAEQCGVRTAWHGPGDMSPIGHAANIHLDLASQNFGVQEWSGFSAPNSILYATRKDGEVLRDVFPGVLEMDKGYVYANDTPGIGVDINEEEAAKYPCVNDVTTWTQTRKTDGSLVTP